MRGHLCLYCQRKPITGRNYKYCREHSAQASAILKRQYRKDWKASGQPYWQDAWENRTPEEKREYFRNYMRQYRRQKRNAQSITKHSQKAS